MIGMVLQRGYCMRVHRDLPFAVVIVALLFHLIDGVSFPDGLLLALSIGQFVALLLLLERLTSEDTPS